MDYEQWRKQAQLLDRRADECRDRIVMRARKVARAAGLSPTMPFLHAHNAMVSREHGRPWREVNYDLARLVLHLEQKSYQPGRLAARIVGRLRPEWKGAR